MTTVGHTLAALSVAAVGMPPHRSWAWRSRWLWLLGPAASIPDFPLPYWGHHRYAVSHSLFVNLAGVALMFVVALVLARLRGRSLQREDRVMLGLVALAWLSHLPLDALYAHGQGVAIFWPFSGRHLAWPVPWFETLSLPVWSVDNRNVLLVELGAFGAIVGLALVVRRWTPILRWLWRK